MPNAACFFICHLSCCQVRAIDVRVNENEFHLFFYKFNAFWPWTDPSGLCLCLHSPRRIQVSFGRDFEQQLSFCVEARASFCNLEPVLVQLIHVSIDLWSEEVIPAHASRSPCLCFKTVNQLAMETRRVMRGSHSRKTAAFVRVSQRLQTCDVVAADHGDRFSVSSRRVLPTVTSPSRLSAASSLVSASTCCLVRSLWRTSVSPRVRFQTVNWKQTLRSELGMMISSPFPPFQRMLSLRLQSVFFQRFLAPSALRANFAPLRVFCWTSSATSCPRCWLSR